MLLKGEGVLTVYDPDERVGRTCVPCYTIYSFSRDIHAEERVKEDDDDDD